MTIKALTFDFWQTLYKSRPIDYDERLQRLKTDVEQGSGATFSLEQFRAAVDVARSTWNRTWVEEHRTIGAEEWLSIIVSFLGVSLDKPNLHDLESQIETGVLNNAPTLVPEVPGVLADLAGRYQLGIISDTGLTPGWVLRQLMERDQIVGYFSQLTFSDEVGRSKPHPDTFLITLQALKTKPTNAVHIGDLLRTDIAGAHGVGMRGIQYVGVNQDTRTTSTKNITPDAVISHHSDIEPMLQRWRNAA